MMIRFLDLTLILLMVWLLRADLAAVREVSLPHGQAAPKAEQAQATDALVRVAPETVTVTVPSGKAPCTAQSEQALIACLGGVRQALVGPAPARAEGTAARATVPRTILLERRALAAPVRSTSARRARPAVPSPSLEAAHAPEEKVARVQHRVPRPQSRAAQRRQTNAAARTTLSEIRGIPARANRAGNNRPRLPLAREPVPRPQTFRAPPRIEEDRPTAAAGAPQPHAVVENIIEWVRKNHAPIPPVVQRHMDYAPGDASAHITWDYEGDRYEIFLMAKPVITQLHAFVVHATRSWYLVDHGLRQEASRARTGTVTWSNGRITFITSSEQPPKGAEVEAIYQLLIRWWNGQAKQ